jgi:hypothetical protein
MTEQLDALELELRRLPGVSFVGFEEHDGVLVVQLLAPGANDIDDLRERAGHLSRAHLDTPVVIELDTGPNRDPAPGERVELLAVLPSPDGREIEVHLAYGGKRTVGRGEIGGGSVSAAVATIDALRSLRLSVPFSVRSAASGLNGTPGDAVVVALSSEPPGVNRFGVASGNTAHEAAARATLHALNRYLSTPRNGQGPAPAPAPTPATN